MQGSPDYRSLIECRLLQVTFHIYGDKMAEKENRMPMQQAGLIRYFDTQGKGVQLKPEHIVGACIIISALIISMKVLL